jgi:hypothetical protein
MKEERYNGAAGNTDWQEGQARFCIHSFICKEFMASVLVKHQLT